MNYTVEHIKEAFRAAKTGLTEAAFLAYLEVKQLVEGKPATKRGRKPDVQAKAAKITAPKGGKAKRGKRGALGVAITKYLSAKGKDGAHVKNIATAVKSKPANVTAWMYTTGKGKVKAHGKNVFSYEVNGS